MATKDDYKNRPQPSLLDKSKTRTDRTINETTSLNIPDRTINEDQTHGVYANSVDSLNTGTEVILDFTLVFPNIWKKNATAEDLQNALRNEVVSRVLMPTDRWNEFVLSYVTSQPALVQLFLSHLGQELGVESQYGKVDDQ